MKRGKNRGLSPGAKLQDVSPISGVQSDPAPDCGSFACLLSGGSAREPAKNRDSVCPPFGGLGKRVAQGKRWGRLDSFLLGEVRVYAIQAGGLCQVVYCRTPAVWNDFKGRVLEGFGEVVDRLFGRSGLGHGISCCPIYGVGLAQCQAERVAALGDGGGREPCRPVTPAAEASREEEWVGLSSLTPQRHGCGPICHITQGGSRKWI